MGTIGGLITNGSVSDGTWRTPPVRKSYYLEFEVTYILWDKSPEAGCPLCPSIPYNLDKTCDGAWKKKDTIDYGMY